MTFSHATIAVAGIHCKMDVEYLVRENGVMFYIPQSMTLNKVDQDK